MSRRIIVPNSAALTTKENLQEISRLLSAQLKLKAAEGILDRNELEAVKTCIHIENYLETGGEDSANPEEDLTGYSSAQLLKFVQEPKPKKKSKQE